MGSKGGISRGRHAIYASHRTRGRATRRTSDQRPSNSSRRAIRPCQGRVLTADSSIAESASIEVPNAKNPRITRARRGPRAPKVHLAHQLSSAYLDSHVPIRPHENPKRAPIQLANHPPVARNLTLVIQVALSMIAQGTRRQIAARNDRRIDRPRAQSLARLQHEVPVHPIPVVFEQHKS